MTPFTQAVFFDVDFTLIYPGPAFQGDGYRTFCARHGMDVDAARFPAAVMSAAHILDREHDAVYDPQIFIDYTAHIIRAMGGSGACVESCAAEIYEEWALCRHFLLYDDVPASLEAIAAKNIRIGVISNSHRCLDAFREHFALGGLIDFAVSSSRHGFMKPHPSIFEAALKLAAVPPAGAVMVGDNLMQDVDGARRVGMRGVLVRRPGANELVDRTVVDVPVIRTLCELSDLL